MVRVCKFCGTDGRLTRDDGLRLYECDGCGAVEVISTSSLSWWYYGWTRPDGTNIDADGKFSAGNKFGWWNMEPVSLSPTRGGDDR